MGQLEVDMKSWIVTWEDPTGASRRNQVNAPDRDSAIFYLALRMQTAHPVTTKFVSCLPEAEAAGHAIDCGHPLQAGACAAGYHCCRDCLSDQTKEGMARYDADVKAAAEQNPAA